VLGGPAGVVAGSALRVDVTLMLVVAAAAQLSEARRLRMATCGRVTSMKRAPVRW